MHANFEISPDRFLADLTEAARKAALKFGFEAPFMDVELDLYETLRQVIRKIRASPCLQRDPGRPERIRAWVG